MSSAWKTQSTSAFIGAITMVAALTALCVTTKLGVIEGDLHLRALAALRAQGFARLEVTLEGRDLTLSGVLLEESDRELALETAQVYGVRIVQDRIRAVESEDLWLRIQVSDEGDVTIRGWVDDREAMQSMRRSLESWFRSGRIDDGSAITGIPLSSSMLEGAWVALPWLAELSPGLLEVTSEKLLLAGRTPRQEVKEIVSPALKAAFAGVAEVDIELGQDPPAGETYEESATSGEPAKLNLGSDSAGAVQDPLSFEACQNRLDGLLDSQDLPFEKWSPRLDAESTSMLVSIATLLNRCPEPAVRITGLADRESQEDVDLVLGRERARSVRAWLAAFGVAVDRMAIEGGYRGAQRTGSRVVRAVELEVGGVDP